MIGSYSAYQKTLSDLVIQLRDELGLTFKGVAEELIKNGYRSPRGFDLGPESVFSIYKKRKRRDTRLQTHSLPQIVELTIERLE
jgi:hypothetical protein